MNHILSTFIMTFVLMASLCHAIDDDFCVGDLSLPEGPTVYACKDPSNVIVDDFVFTGFRTGKPTNTNVFNISVTLAFAKEFPGVNGLGISMARLYMGVGGVVPVLNHMSSELINVVKGKIIAGFIDNKNNAYYKTLEVGDVMVFPPLLLHFVVNVGESPALVFSSFNNVNVGLINVPTSFCSGNLPSELVEKITILDPQQVMKLKEVLSGTN